MLKILVVTPCPTHPAVEGNSRRILSLIKALRGLGHSTTILYLPHCMFSVADLDAMHAEWGENLHVAPAKWDMLPARLRNRLLKWLEAHLPRARIDGALDCDRLVEPRWLSLTRSLWERHRFDVVVAEYVFMSRILTVLPQDVLKLIDTHDSFGRRNDILSNLPKHQRWLTTTRIEEARGLDRADRVIAIQEEEAAYFRSITQRPVVTLGHMLEDITRSKEPSGPPTAMLVASANPINVRSITVFLNEVWPLVHRALPDARLRLFGKICDALSQDSPGLMRCGIVADSQAMYDQSHVVISPQYEATGLSIKSIEALSFGKPLVTTPIGARGLMDGAGTAFRMASDPKEMATELERLLSDRIAREQLADNAFHYAQKWRQRQLDSLVSALAPLTAAQPKRNAVPST